MDYIESLFNKNFLEYASYVIRDRAIPDLEDGLKPVQRRILHSLFEMDDGKFHKVANVVGHCMKYHPHGDASIGNALVVLANKELFISKQGNFGNIYTGDEASAARYIECRITEFGKSLLYNPNITQYVPSYDGRNKEPLVFRAKIPVVLVIGAEGIAVGMSTKILPHNIKEILEAEIQCIEGKPFALYPDFPTGGLIDVSEYGDGLGKVLVRAKLDTSDEKRIVIKELPFGSTTESMITSIENASKSGKVKVSEINDYTAETVEIELKLPRGVYSQDVVDSLYAFTECEQSISCNLLVIKNNLPQQMTVTDVIKNHVKQLLQILKDELEYERAMLQERLHMRTLERIFIEERIYKKIETMKTASGVITAVLKGFEPFRAELIRDITEDDVDKLLKIPIRRISLYDINKNRQETEEIQKRLKEIAKLLKNLKGYARSVLEGILAKLDSETVKRKTEITGFTKIDVKEAVSRDISLRYDEETGYLGTSVTTGKEILKVTPYDRIFILRKSGVYTVTDVPDRLFVDTGMWYCGFAEKEELSQVLFTLIYKDAKTGCPYIKRCRVEGYILNRDYLIVPDDATLLFVHTAEKFDFTVQYEPKPRVKKLEENFKAQDYQEKGLRTLGIKLSNRIATSANLAVKKQATKKSSQ
ncbi:DNA topoisomerase IV subunit A [Treponema phagedenis]|uniref:DNA topoisomerase IV subunit A n=1 Tax=Treponema phagedenis TaxID=162 RepID=A0AAE6M6J4_TREPH|nr:DNA topoisomerase IV subunit A [Treponema phagedenis]QEJ94611.1 DNA topoisomerase IV subunit A [Treponema phagedenis]QEJ97618.1 DNA topoisomerase IV subunit A [Treponema phagedenis]QEK00586.1 DNA topoisomerase IV subunit A [Treponema phagedenis]QEK03187.1 DNA topoisomerase IV subunit A [Treponema phagedenis]QEK05594.1 DNA topoisomerase IV subunit A [Treponema phagedenis]